MSLEFATIPKWYEPHTALGGKLPPGNSMQGAGRGNSGWGAQQYLLYTGPRIWCYGTANT